MIAISCASSSEARPYNLCTYFKPAAADILRTLSATAKRGSTSSKQMDVWLPKGAGLATADHMHPDWRHAEYIAASPSRPSPCRSPDRDPACRDVARHDRVRTDDRASPDRDRT